MGLLTKLSKNRQYGESAEDRMWNRPIPSESRPVALVAQQRFTLPPPIPCPICFCPGIWISIYDVQMIELRPASQPGGPPTFRCLECEPPPSWSMIGTRWILRSLPPNWTRHEWEIWPRRLSRDDGPSQDNALADLLGGVEADGGASGDGSGTDDVSFNADAETAATARADRAAAILCRRFAAADRILQGTRRLIGF